jgi:hypothetical protein
MIALYDHIQELRAELRGCLTRSERATVQAELAAAVAAQSALPRGSARVRTNTRGSSRATGQPVKSRITADGCKAGRSHSPAFTAGA